MSRITLAMTIAIPFNGTSNGSNNENKKQIDNGNKTRKNGNSNKNNDNPLAVTAAIISMTMSNSSRKIALVMSKIVTIAIQQTSRNR